MTHDAVTDAMIEAGKQALHDLMVANRANHIRAEDQLVPIYLAMKEASKPAVEGPLAEGVGHYPLGDTQVTPEIDKALREALRKSADYLGPVAVEGDELVERLCNFHKRLSLCFEGATGEPPPSRPWPFEPQWQDTETLLDAATALSRIRVDEVREAYRDFNSGRESISVDEFNARIGKALEISHDR